MTSGESFWRVLSTEMTPRGACIIDFLPGFEEFSKKAVAAEFLQVLTDAPIPMPILPPDLTVREICEGNESRLLELWTVDIVDALYS